MITNKMIGKVYDRINFWEHGEEGIAEGLEQVFREDLGELLAGADDLDKVQAALVRERVIRDTMAKSGEERQHVADMLDAMASMGQEAVLELTEGEPTTLRDALQRYADNLAQASGDMEALSGAQVADDLATILAYPYPRVTVEDEEGPNAHHSLIKLGDQVIGRIDTGREGASVADDTAEIICRALQG